MKAADPLISAEVRTLLNLANVLRPADRATFKDLLTRKRKIPQESGAAAVRPPSATVGDSDGTEAQVVVYNDSGTDDERGRPVLRWEVQESGRTSFVGAVPPRIEPGVLEQVRAIAAAAIDIARSESSADALDLIVGRACGIFAGCEEAGITIVRARGRLEASASTGPMARACGELEIELQEGPSFQVVGDGRPVRVTDVATDARWPGFGPRAAEAGAGSVLALPLVTARGVVGVLRLHSASVGGFDELDEVIAGAFAVHAGVELAHLELETNLRIGMQTREEIGRAVGILMERHRITSTAAFDMLVLASQHSHQKLRDVAAWMTETGEDPTRLIRGAVADRDRSAKSAPPPTTAPRPPAERGNAAQ